MKRVPLSMLIILMLAACGAAANTNLQNSVAITVSLVNQDPDPAIAGEVVEVRVGLGNLGGESTTNLMADLVPAYPFEEVPGESLVQQVGVIQAYQGQSDNTLKIIKFKVRVNRDAAAGSYELKVRTYEQGSTTKEQTSLSIDVKSKQSAEVIHIDKTTLVPGKQSSLAFVINNVGNSPLRDISFYWENADDIILPVGSDNTRYIKYIDIGDSAQVDYQVIADTNAQAGLYKLDLFLSFEDTINRSTKTVETIAGVYVGGGTDFDVAFSESASGATSFSIANIGSNPATSVSVAIPEQRGWTVTGSSSSIIGNLNKGDYTVASFNLQSTGSGFQNRSAQGMRNPDQQFQRPANATVPSTVKVQITYTDTMGERQVVEKEVRVGISSISTAGATAFAGRRTAQQGNFFSKYRWYLILAGALVLAVIVYQVRKRKHLHQKAK
ncbi:MAG: COG1361 S-layer family protein [Nanoarchaeota archaeon]